MLPVFLALALGADPALGTYRVEATARLTGVPLLGRLELRGDVVLRPAGDAPRVRAHLAARGHACDVDGTLAADGTLELVPGPRCPIVLDDPGARGRVEATLRSGNGRVREGRIALDLELDLAGTVRLPTGGLPGMPAETAVPVDGGASVRAEGGRDNSRAAEAGGPDR